MLKKRQRRILMLYYRAVFLSIKTTSLSSQTFINSDLFRVLFLSRQFQSDNQMSSLHSQGTYSKILACKVTSIQPTLISKVKLSNRNKTLNKRQRSMITLTIKKMRSALRNSGSRIFPYIQTFCNHRQIDLHRTRLMKLITSKAKMLP